MTVPRSVSSPDPLTVDDILLGVSRLPASMLGDLFNAADNGQPLESVGRQVPSYSGERAAGETDAGAHEIVSAGQGGLRIEVAGQGGRRAGLVTWARIDDLLRPGATPGRRQIVTRALQLAVDFMAAGASFRAVAESRLATAAEEELRRHAAAALTAILAAARPAPGPPRLPAAGEDVAAERIARLAAALPAGSRARIPSGQVKAGDIIGHPGYWFQPFLVAEQPRQVGATVEIAGRLAEPSDTDPTEPIVLTVPSTGPAGHVVTIPIPARSLRSLFPGLETAAGAGQYARAARPDRGSASSAENAEEVGIPISVRGASQPVPQPAKPSTFDTPSQEETMPPVTDPPAPQQPPAPAEPVPAPQSRPQADGNAVGDHAARPGDGTSLAQEMERVLEAIAERRGTAGGDSDFGDIRAAFAALRDSLDLHDDSLAAGPGPEPGTRSPAAAPSTHGEPRTADSFTDIREAFADLRQVLDLPPQGRHTRGDGPPDDTDAAIARALDQADAEAQACARWYRDTPEWQRTSTVARAARGLVTAIREAARDYWAEIRLDIRVRGFARTLAARTALAVSGAAHAYAARVEREGHRDSPAWRSAWRLHQATTTLASRVMRYDSPGSPGRVADARSITDDLRQQQRRAQPGPGRHAAARSADTTRAPNAAALASTSFPVTVTRDNARQAAEPPAARTPIPTPRPYPARRL